VPQDFQVGQEVMRISASDIDDGNNSLIYYEMEAIHQQDEGYFRIDKNSGIIRLEKNLTDVSYLKKVTFFRIPFTNFCEFCFIVFPMYNEMDISTSLS